MVYNNIERLQQKNAEFEERYNKKSEELLVDTLIKGLNRLISLPNNEGLFKLGQVLHQVNKKVIPLIENALQMFDVKGS
jgi:hypothetical protein